MFRDKRQEDRQITMQMTADTRTGWIGIFMGVVSNQGGLLQVANILSKRNNFSDTGERVGFPL